MKKSYAELSQNLGRGVKTITKQAPQLMEAYAEVASASSKAGGLDTGGRFIQTTLSSGKIG
jgi:hypothetical protein